MTTRASAAVLCLVLGWLAPAHAAPEHGLSVFRDSEDGRFDMSRWLLDRKGFLPVPIIITEPAVGFGGGLAPMFFSESMASAAMD